MSNVRGRTLLDAVAAAVDGPEAWVGPLAVDGAVIHHSLPAKHLPLTDLRALLLHREASYDVRNAVWAELAFMAQHHGGDWELGAVWMMTPGLRKAAWRVVGDGGVPYADMEAEVVEGFLRELRTIDVEVPSIAARLWWAGYRHGLRARESYRPTAWRTEIADPARLRPHSAPSGHPDLVLDRAVRAGAISGDEAELIGSTRLEEGGLASAAARMDLGYQACRSRRMAAEKRLARFLVVPGPQPASAPEKPTQVNVRVHKEAA
jgi:hypothetical protein